MNKKSVSYSQPLPEQSGGKGDEEMSWSDKHTPASTLKNEDSAGAGMPPELMAATEDAAGARNELQANQQQAEMQLQQTQQQAEAAAAKAEMDAEMAAKQNEMAVQIAEKESEMKSQQAQLQADTEIAKRDAQISNLENQIAQAGAASSSADADSEANQTASRKATTAKLQQITSKLDSIGNNTRTYLGLPKVASLLDHCDNTAYQGWVKQAAPTPQGASIMQQAQQKNPALEDTYASIDKQVPTAGQGGRQELGKLWDQGPNRYYDQMYSAPEHQGGITNTLRDMTIGAGSNVAGGLMDWGRGAASGDWSQAMGGLKDAGKGALYMSGAYDKPQPTQEPQMAAPQGETDIFGNLREIFGNLSGGLGSMAAGRPMSFHGFRDMLQGIKGIQDMQHG